MTLLRKDKENEEATVMMADLGQYKIINTKIPFSWDKLVKELSRYKVDPKFYLISHPIFRKLHEIIGM